MNTRTPEVWGFGRSALFAVGCFLFVLLSLRLISLAQDPTPSCSPTPTPAQPSCTPHINGPCPTATPLGTPAQSASPDPVAIPEDFQPPDGTILAWRIFSPSGDGPWPVVILLHEGGF